MVGCVNNNEHVLTCVFSNYIILSLQHIIYAHGAYFMDKYGSLDMWSSQGMEKSHYKLRGVYFKNARHGGGAFSRGTHTNYL